MPRSRRLFISKQPYMLTFRVAEGLPFTATHYMKLILEGCIARTQRNYKVTLCHHLWMGNHPHIVAVFKDAELAKRFYTEVQKKLTDAIKRLLGIEHLNIWSRSPRVIELVALRSAMKMIAYYYANPAKANLVERIEECPGCRRGRTI